MLKFVQTHGMGGDCTAPYDVELDKPYTVAEFINEVLSTRKSEWGTIQVKGAFFLKYRYGKTEQEIPEQYANLSVKKVKAAGGYTAMSYDVDVEFKEEVENKINQRLFDIKKRMIAENLDCCENEKLSKPLDSCDPIWEARKYEVAKDILLTLIKDEIHNRTRCQLDETVAHYRAVSLAGKFIEELKKQ